MAFATQHVFPLERFCPAFVPTSGTSFLRIVAFRAWVLLMDGVPQEEEMELRARPLDAHFLSIIWYWVVSSSMFLFVCNKHAYIYAHKSTCTIKVRSSSISCSFENHYYVNFVFIVPFQAILHDGGTMT